MALAAFAGFSALAQPLVISNAAPVAIPRRASIIFIQVDGLGYGDLSCYGQTNFQTPNLDKLAAGGIRFTNYSIANNAAQSHAALLTGKNVSRARAPLPANAVTVAQILKLAGYRTGAIGDWDLGNENSAAAPWKKGFDQFAGYLNADAAANFYAEYMFRYAPRTILDSPEKPAHFIGREMLYYNTGGKHATYIPDLLATAAANFAKENQPDAFNRWRPFFLLVNFKIPDGKIEVPSDAPFSEESWPQPEKNRAAFIARIDGYVSQLQEQLTKLGMTNNVLVFFAGASAPKKTAETDPAFFQENLSAKDLRAPLIVNWPEHIPAGAVSGLKCSPADFLPTAAEIGYAKLPADVDGVSILNTLIGGK